MPNSISESLTGSLPISPTSVSDLEQAQQAGSSRAVEQKTGKTSDVVGASSATDSTDFSPVGGALGAAAKTSASAGTVRNDLVAALKQQIAAGTYQPDMTALATRVSAAIRQSKG